MLPPNEYGCVYASLSRPAINLQMPILAKKKSSFQTKLILILVGMKTSKIVTFGAQKTRTHTLKSRDTQNGSRGIIGKFFFENEQGEAVTVNGDSYRAMLNEKKLKRRILAPFGFNRRHYLPHSPVLRPGFEDCIISRRSGYV